MLASIMVFSEKSSTALRRAALAIIKYCSCAAFKLRIVLTNSEISSRLQR